LKVFGIIRIIGLICKIAPTVVRLVIVNNFEDDKYLHFFSHFNLI
jgi:hypothetical protein